MAADWQLRVYEQQRLVHTVEGTGSIELGRQNVGEPAPFGETRDPKLRRLIIARYDEDSISRKHVHLEPLLNDQIRVINLSSKLPIFVSGNMEVLPGKVIETSLPTVLTVGNRTVRMQPVSKIPEESIVPLHSLIQSPTPPLGTSVPRMRDFDAKPGTASGMETDQLLRWLQAAMGVLQGVAGSREFFPRAARAVVDLVGLDSGRVLLLDAGKWRVQAAEHLFGEKVSPDWQPSRQVLSNLVAEKRTFWIGTQGNSDRAQSLIGMDAVVAAPILDASGAVIGALYGDRKQASVHGASSPITRLEASLVELLAGGVAAGLACMEQEQAAIRARVQFEQFFTPELSRQLEAEPDLLRGRDCAITVLFCDIRHFSRYSERLGPAKTVEWLSDVLGELSECVLAHHGVLVDYMGDELMAMWGAPVEQPEQVRLAAAAALDMQALVPKLSEKWATILGGPMAFGVGVNSGTARVGNMGTERKFKYGPLGNTVNIASRVQGATKYLKAPLLITRATRAGLAPDFPARRVCQVRVVNINEPIALYELAPLERPGWSGLARGYEAALDRFEQRDHDAAMRMLFQLLNEHPDDGPSLVLLSRVIAHRDSDPTAFDPVWELPGK